MHATIRRYEGVDTTRMSEVVGKFNTTLVPQLRELPGFSGYYLIEAGNGVLSSFGLFETGEQAVPRLVSVQGAVPEVGDRRLGQEVSLPPVGPVVVCERAASGRATPLTQPVAPAVVERDAVGRVGREQRGAAPSSRRATSSALVGSPQRTRWWPRSHSWPGST